VLKADNFDFLVIGAGPTALEVVKFLCKKDLSKNLRIAIIAPELVNVKSSLQERLTSIDNFADRTQTTSTTKISKLEMGNTSQAYYWGASCLPILNLEELSKYFISSYVDIVSSWQIQAEYDNLQQNYPITSEQIGLLQRKQLAVDVVESSKLFNFPIGHSRLALSTLNEDACTLKGKCFEGCSNNSPWNPGKVVKHLKTEFPYIVWIEDSVTSLRQDQNEWLAITSSSKVYKSKNIVLSAGWKSNLSLLKGLSSFIHSTDEKDVLGSNVSLIPVFIAKRSKGKDYFNSFVYHDLVLSLPKENLFVQLYLPTIEITKRIIHEVTGLTDGIFFEFLKFILARTVGRHIGIAMVFSDSSPIDTKKILEKHKIHTVRVAVARDLRAIHAYLLSFKVKSLSPEDSYHVGAFRPLHEIGQRLLRSNQMIEPLSPGLHIVGPMLLPNIEPGPHTISAAALSVAYFKRLFGANE
jgi:hypothetical protein